MKALDYKKIFKELHELHHFDIHHMAEGQPLEAHGRWKDLSHAVRGSSDDWETDGKGLIQELDPGYETYSDGQGSCTGTITGATYAMQYYRSVSPTGHMIVTRPEEVYLWPGVSMEKVVARLVWRTYRMEPDTWWAYRQGDLETLRKLREERRSPRSFRWSREEEEAYNRLLGLPFWKKERKILFVLGDLTHAERVVVEGLLQEAKVDYVNCSPDLEAPEGLHHVIAVECEPPIHGLGDTYVIRREDKPCCPLPDPLPEQVTDYLHHFGRHHDWRKWRRVYKDLTA